MTDGPGAFGAELRTARAAAAAAAAIIAGHGPAGAVREKGPGDLVTEVDEAAERAVAECIREAFPDDVVVGEELSAGAAGVGRRWVVDPVDGTTNFVHGHPFVCCSVALVDDAGPVVGVVHAPFLREVYHAVRSGGAFLNGRPLRVTGTDDPARALIATGFPFKSGKGALDEYMRLVADALRASQGVRRAGSAALDLAYVACGRVDAFFELGLSPWDVAAGILLVTEAGGRVSGWPGDHEPPLETGRVLASNGALHPWLASLAARYVERL